MLEQTWMSYLKPPKNFLNCLILLLPIIASQILQRLYPMIDTRYLSVLGTSALYIHSIQYNFVSMGQFIGAATATSCLVFWNRVDLKGKQGGIFTAHLVLVSIFTLLFACVLWFLAKSILNIYSVSSDFINVGIIYFQIGLINMFLQAIYCTLDGMLIASNQRKFSMLLSFLLVILNFIADYYVAYYLFNGNQTPTEMRLPIMIFGLSTTVILLLAIFIASTRVIKSIDGWNWVKYSEMIHVWIGEQGVALVSSIVPFVYAYQMKFIHTTQSFLVMYQMVLHLSYIFCLPFLSALKVAVTEASREHSLQQKTFERNEWWNILLYTGLIPTYILFTIGCVFPKWLVHITYQYNIPADQIIFVTLFYISCMIGQIGNSLSVPIRAAKQSKLISRNFFWTEVVIMLGCMQIAIFFNIATSITAGIVTLIFVISYTLMNLQCLKSINVQREISYETAN